jgi:mono/diheme cytochrome c family protein
MKRTISILFLTVFLLAGCSLAGDVTPPPGLEAQQNAQPLPTLAPADPPAAQPAESPHQNFPVSAPDLENGAAIYADKCEPCHGPQGLGDGSQAADLPIPAAPLGNPEFMRTARPVDWFQMVSEGNLERFMPGFSSLNEAERWDVVAYALSLAVANEEIASGSENYIQFCGECHGASGEGTSSGPILADLFLGAGSSVEQVFFTISLGAGDSMPAYEDDLSEDQRWALAAYIQQLGLTAGEGQQPEIAEPAVDPELALGSISGQVVNGSGEGLPVEFEVQLHAYDGQDEVISESIAVGSDGRYSFPDLELVPGRLFFVSAEYQGNEYLSDVAHLATEGSLDLPLTVYETTSDTSQVRVDRLHVLLDFLVEDRIEVVELLVLSNPTNRSITAEDGKGVLQVTLPEGAANLSFEDGVLGERFIATDDGFIDQAPLLPGFSSSQLVFSFTLPYKNKLEYEQTLDYPVDAVVLITQDGGPVVEGDALTDMGAQVISGTTLRSYSSGSFQPGDVLEFTVKGRPLGAAGEAGAAATGLPTGVLVGVGAFGLVLIAGGLWLWGRNKNLDKKSETELEDHSSAESISVDETNEAILQIIADLDDAFEAGELEETEYQRRRSELKQRLISRMSSSDD